LGDAVGRAADSAGHVGAVAVAVAAVPAVADGVEAANRAPAELRVREANAGVDDVGRDAAAGAGVDVGPVERTVGLVDAIEPPRGVVLRRDDLHHGVFLD